MSEVLELLEKRIVNYLERSLEYYGDIARIAEGDREEEELDYHLIKSIFSAHLAIIHYYEALGKIKIGE